MIEVRGNLWEHPAEVKVITTNGYIKKNGEAVMGRGCAKEAVLFWPDFPRILGYALSVDGNHVYWYEFGDKKITTFPVKNNWYENADLSLIERSTKELVEGADAFKDSSFVIPRPGCGNGHLFWEDVKSVIEPYLDDRFYIITW